MQNRKLLILSLMVVMILLAGCGAKESLAVRSVETFFQGIIEKDMDLVSSVICDSYEFEAMLDFNTFAIVQTSLQDFSCQETGENDGFTLVNCEGRIQAKFGDEIRNFELSKRTYQVIEENATWLVCGHSDVD